MKKEKKLDSKTIFLVSIITGITILIEVILLFAYKSVDDSSRTKQYAITKGGTYTLDENKECIAINTNDDVTLKLNNISVTCQNGPGINVIKAKSVNIELVGENSIYSKTTDLLDGAIYSKADLTLSGDGTLTVTSNYDGIVSKDNLVITGGVYKIKSQDDGIRGKDSLTIKNGTFEINASGDGLKSTIKDDSTKGIIKIDGGKFTINSADDGIHSNGMINITNGEFEINAVEGIEATYVKIDGGKITINASDDGINAAKKSEGYTVGVEITGGELNINMGSGDTDGIDSNGNLTLTGGTININCNAPFDYDGTLTFTGGTIIVNGEQTNTIKNQVMGPAGGGPGGPGNPPPGAR